MLRAGAFALRQRPRVASASACTRLLSASPACAHGGHSHGAVAHRGLSPAENRLVSRVVQAGTLADIGLVLAKGTAGFMTGSSALISDAAHSVADVLVSLSTMLVMRLSSKAPDADHPHGHGRWDSLGGLAISGMLVATGGTIGLRALQEAAAMLRGEPPQPLMAALEHVPTELFTDGQAASIAVGACLLSMGLKEAIFRWTIRVGMTVRSSALIANAWHHRADSLSSLVAAAGIGGAMMGFPVLDPLGAFVIAGMIVKAGAETGVTAVRELLDERLDDDVLREGVYRAVAVSTVHHAEWTTSRCPATTADLAFAISMCQPLPYHSPYHYSVMSSYHYAVISAAVDIIRAHRDVKGIRRIRGRRNGPAVLLDCELAVPPGISVGAAEEIAATIRGSVYRERREVAEMLINFVPADEWDHIDAHPSLPGGAAEHAVNSSATGSGSGSSSRAAAGAGAANCGHGHGHGRGHSHANHHDDDDHDHDHDGHGHSHGDSNDERTGAAATLARYSMHELQEMIRSALLTGVRPSLGAAAGYAPVAAAIGAGKGTARGAAAPATGHSHGVASKHSAANAGAGAGSSSSLIRAITLLDVHPEADASRALHVHAKLALDPSIPLRDALATVRRLQGVLRGMRLPIHKAADGSAAVPDAGFGSPDADCWEVLVADVQLETGSL